MGEPHSIRPEDDTSRKWVNRKPRSERVLFFLIPFIALVLLGGFLWAAVHTIFNPPTTEVVKDYYRAIQSQDYTTAYTYLDATSVTLKSQPVTQQVFLQTAQALDAREGKVSSYSLIRSKSNGLFDASTVAFTVRVTRNKQSYDVHLITTVEGEGWKIVSLDGI